MSDTAAGGDDAADRPERVPAGVDITVPSPARIYDFMLGGSHNFAVDREVAARASASSPVAAEMAVANRAFLARAVRTLLDAGIRQFLDLGSGIPTVGSVHEIARAEDPESRVVYVDHDRIAVAHGEQVLRGDDRAIALLADVRAPATVLAKAAATGLLDLDRPLGLLLVTTLHYVGDDAGPASIMRRYRTTLAPGSHLVLTHLTDEIRADEVAHTVELMRPGPSPVFARDRAAITALFGDFTLLGPGLVPATRWRPEPGTDVADPPILAGVAVAPGT
ncbi:S-adenosyl methyltransferase [Pseudonocardia sediminis]|uniref:S-adenosyl methyltransferase n=1 Tax=Pseudonocardia sediminis TaxID=1397368 RepID=A0A4Q7V2A3_PSEST|nr:SAM-dependent methyltransferase [Pseudonocardia sediminis]RZT87608.1 S-adenosyl methyltransferase [Pseudonocardia sediminis]